MVTYPVDMTEDMDPQTRREILATLRELTESKTGE